MKRVHILDVLAKTPCVYHVPELRNLLIFIFWRIWGGFFGRFGGIGGVCGGSNMWGVVKDEGGSYP